MVVEQAYTARNRAELERLRRVVGGLTDEQMRTMLDNEWSVSAALAHLAFWDWLVLAQLERWEREGEVRTNPFDSELLNSASLPAWLALAPSDVRREVVAAAEAADEKVAALSESMVATVLAAGRSKAIERANHRRNHLDEIEAALGRSS